MEKEILLPVPFLTVNITFKDKNQKVITKKGFYSTYSEGFVIPPEYREFNGSLVPFGFGALNVSIEKVLKWTNL